jgi:hypothetical protein
MDRYFMAGFTQALLKEAAGAKKKSAPKKAPARAAKAVAEMSPFEYVRGAKVFGGLFKKAPFLDQMQMRRHLTQSLFGFLSGDPKGIRYALTAISKKGR